MPPRSCDESGDKAGTITQHCPEVNSVFQSLNSAAPGLKERNDAKDPFNPPDVTIRVPGSIGPTGTNTTTTPDILLRIHRRPRKRRSVYEPGKDGRGASPRQVDGRRRHPRVGSGDARLALPGWHNTSDLVLCRELGRR